MVRTRWLFTIVTQQMTFWSGGGAWITCKPLKIAVAYLCRFLHLAI